MKYFFLKKIYICRDSLVVQWLGLGAFTAVAWLQSLVGELRSLTPCSVAKKKKDMNIHITPKSFLRPPLTSLFF